MTREEATNVLGDVRAYLASRASLENEILAGHTFTDICNAIKALEQEPGEDCVSRQAVLDTKVLIELPDGQSFYCISPEDVEEIPPVTPTTCIAKVTFSKDDLQELVDEKVEELAQHMESRWIPVSERLPSDGKYLVTRGDVIGRPMIGMRYFGKDLSKVDEFDFVDKKGISGWCEYDSEYGWYIDDKVTAWMPLPEPYKAEMESEE